MHWKKSIKIMLSALLILIGYYFITSVSYYPLQSISREKRTEITHRDNYNRFINKRNYTKKIDKVLETFPWKLFNASVFDRNPKNHYILTERLISDLIPFITMEPLVPINQHCKPPLFKPLNCSRSTILKTPRRIAVLLQFGFDVDNLEIHLNELYDIVDRFFILESYRAHFGALRKPLIWDIVKGQERFKKFQSKIIQFVLDDSDMVQMVGGMKRKGNRGGKLSTGTDFGIESLYEKLRWEKFQRWNNVTGYFKDDDLLGFGDIDEIPSRHAINYLKNCEFKTDPVDIGIWFPFGNINQAFQTHFPVSNEYRFSLGDPTYWKLKTAKSLSKENSDTYPSRNRGKSPAFVLGGMHLSHYGYLPYQIIKRLTQTERGLKEVDNIVTLFEAYFNGELGTTLKKLERVFADIPETKKDWIYDVNKMKKFRLFGMDQIAILPWFYDCNRLRYSSWEGRHDTRLD